MTHPRSFELEAFACGDPSDDARVERHVAACAECRAYVARVGALAVPTARAFDHANAPRLSGLPRPAVPFVALMAGSFALAAAAAFVVQLRGARGVHDEAAKAHGGAVEAASSADPFAPSPESTGRGETAFKGGVQLALVRDRHGVQERLTGRARVRPGDRLRFEIALDHPESVTAGVVGDDGSFVPVMADATRAVGTHYSERALGVDASPMSGYAVVGSREAVDAARARGDLSGVASLRIEWEAEP